MCLAAARPGCRYVVTIDFGVPQCPGQRRRLCLSVRFSVRIPCFLPVHFMISGFRLCVMHTLFSYLSANCASQGFFFGVLPSVGRRLFRPLSRKEVFQPHLPVRLPCYDLAPVTCLTLGRSFRSRTSGTPGSHGLTGGVYKARERIHRAVADARLLANPASWSRVADSNPN